jgi:alpha/beta hydrolase family protein
MKDLRAAKLITLVSILVLIGSLAEARVTRIQITSREVVADGMSFGQTGPYEKLRGTVFFEVDPDNPHNAVVFDLDKVQPNDRGMVEFAAEMFILKPVDLAKGNGELFFDVNNRGGKLALPLMNDVAPGTNDNNPSDARDFGNGFLLRKGFVIAWVGWGADVAPGNDRLTVNFPIASEHEKPITELILTEFSSKNFGGGTPFTLPLSGNASFKSYEAVSTDQTVAMAELRVRPTDSPRPSAPGIPDGEVVRTRQWSFASCPDGPPGTPSTTDICLGGGFRNDKVYQLKYSAMNPPVMGLGYVTSRDFASFLRNEIDDDSGNPNPVPGISTVLCYGVSQSGTYLRDFVYQGFNEDEHGQRVCDGMHIEKAGVLKLFLNYRFAQPNPSSAQHAERYTPDTNFPRTYAIRQDPLTGKMDGLLKRPATDPKVIHTDTALEYWQFRAPLVDTDEDGALDVIQPDNVRRYVYSSTQHATRKGAPPGKGIGNRQCQQLSNPTHNGIIARALLVALDKWVREGTAPPESRYSRIDDDTLIGFDRYCSQFPSIPGVTCNGLYNASGERDFGPRVSGNRGVIDHLIPLVLGEHRLLVPKVDEIGNEMAGIRHPSVEVPTATLTGWNLNTPEFTDGDLCGLNGMMIPLRRSGKERLAAGDPRPSLEELYGDHNGYVLKVAQAALNLWSQRLMLLEDVFQTIQEASDSDVLKYNDHPK